jgi:filamentous hemagglutinin
MNKNRHRINFNAAQGQRTVVAENASSVGDGDRSEATLAIGSAEQSLGDLDICKPNPLRNLALHPVTLSIALALTLGFVFLTTARAQIVADPNAPGNQRLTVLQTANGVPQIKIQTPSAAGVSRNTYRQFDVQSNGAILNNSRTNTSTQLGGFVVASPWVATWRGPCHPQRGQLQQPQPP